MQVCGTVVVCSGSAALRPAKTGNFTLEVFRKGSDGVASDALVRCIPIAIREDKWSARVPGDLELTIRLRRASGLELFFLDKGESSDVYVEVNFEPLDGARIWESKRSGPGWVLMNAHDPGRYRVSVGLPLEYAEVPPFYVTLPGGDLLRRTLELKRRGAD